MPVEAANSSPLSINPKHVRYSMTINHAAQNGERPARTFVSLSLIRSQRTDIGNGLATWIDDPRPNARKTVIAHKNPVVMAALNALLDLIAQNAAIFGLQSFPTDYNLILASVLTPQGVGDVCVTLNAQTPPANKTIRSVNALLGSLAGNAGPFVAAWEALDQSVSSENLAKNWV